MSTADFPGVRWHGHWVAPDVPEFVIDPTSVGSDLPPAEFSRAQFRRVFDVEAVPPRVPLRLSADSRYVLWVNSAEVGRGPIRSQPRRLRYDEYDIAPYLRPGAQCRGGAGHLWLGNTASAAWARGLWDQARHGYEDFWDRYRGSYVDHIVGGERQLAMSQAAGAVAIVSGLAPHDRWAASSTSSLTPPGSSSGRGRRLRHDQDCGALPGDLPDRLGCRP